ncbi:MlaA family lipoprotein [Aliikangiella sp. IMCC44653]
MSRLILSLVAIIGLSGCASQSSHQQDPWEGWNRGVYQFNKVVDDNIARPATVGYKAITPDFIEAGVTNVFANLADIPTMFNNLLQGKLGDSISDLGRVVVNTTVGIGGLWDPASEMGLLKHDEDFGQTLGKWGVPSGPYVMLPFMGPSTLRDTFAYPVNSQMDIMGVVDHVPTRNQLKLLELLDRRSSLMKFEDQLKDAMDEYAFVRDVYLQNRRYKVLDGNIPFEEDCEFEENCEF